MQYVKENYHKYKGGVEELNSSDEEDETEDKRIDFRRKVLEGSFLPAIAMLRGREISVEDIIDEN